MTEENSAYTISDPDVFSRGSLKLTYDMVRSKNAQLALTVRNITGGEPLPRQDQDSDSKYADYFRVELDSFQVRAIVEALMEQVQESAQRPDNPGAMIVAKTLIDEWLALARKMFAELPDDQKPSGLMPEA